MQSYRLCTKMAKTMTATQIKDNDNNTKTKPRTLTQRKDNDSNTEKRQ